MPRTTTSKLAREQVVSATEEQSERTWRIGLDELAYHLPALLKVGRGTAKLKIVNVYDQEQLEFFMPKARAPRKKFLETNAA